MSRRYAADTSVSSEKSRGEIERTLARYKANKFMYGWDESDAAVGFNVNGREVRFVLPLPDRNDREFTHTPSTKRARTATQAEEAYEQATRQRWRALALVIKAKLEAVEAGIVTFEDEFAMHMVLPGGRTVREYVLPAIEHAYETGSARHFLAIESGN